MSTETPLFDELEEKWNAVGTDRRICDKYMRCFLIETGAEWLEDDEGNEVFLEPDLDEGQYTVGAEEEALASQLRRDYMRVYREPQYAEGGVVKGSSPEVQRLLENFDNDCPVALVPKRKFKLFGRNQGTNGTL